MEGDESQVIAQETPVEDVFAPPSICDHDIIAGESYTYHTALPRRIADEMLTECVLGVDEAGRGPVLGLHLLQASCSKLLSSDNRSHGLWSTIPSIVATSFVACRNPSFR